MNTVSQTQSQPPQSTAALVRDTSRPGAIFTRALRENVSGVLIWGLGYSLLVVVAVIIYPILRENNVIINLLSGFGILNVFASNYGVDTTNLVGFKGYISFQALSWGPLILALYSVPKAMTMILEEEKRGTLDLLLSTPIPRWRLLTEKTLALLASLVGIIAIVWVTLLVTMAFTPQPELTFYEATTTVWHLLPINCVIAMGALFVSTLVRQANIATSIVGVFVLASFFLRAIADAAQEPTLLQLKTLSIFNYFSTITILSFVSQPRWDLLLLGIALVLFVLALIAFQRRDIQP